MISERALDPLKTQSRLTIGGEFVRPVINDVAESLPKTESPSQLPGSRSKHPKKGPQKAHRLRVEKLASASAARMFARLDLLPQDAAIRRTVLVDSTSASSASSMVTGRRRSGRTGRAGFEALGGGGGGCGAKRSQSAFAPKIVRRRGSASPLGAGIKVLRTWERSRRGDGVGESVREETRWRPRRSSRPGHRWLLLLPDRSRARSKVKLTMSRLKDCRVVEREWRRREVRFH